ncbi:fungal-specific transcription factor domain-containing protein [Camillea tinctor]|nr:fungal-specific transcription factor domain-containing protein [Camillea tinctor]
MGVWTNLFTMPSKTIKNTSKNKRAWVWLAPWSTWSFTVRLMLMLDEKLHPENPSTHPGLIDPDVYTLTWETSSSAEFPDLSTLPSFNHAIYLFNTVKFHLGQTYRLFDEAEFEDQIRNFYTNASPRIDECRLWFVKFLLILAFGTAFQAPPTDTQEPPGAKIFKQAMALVPDTTSLWKDSLLAIEVLAFIGLYLFSIYERESAHIYLGQPIRIVQLEGLHTQLPEKELGTETTTHCRDLWWTLYIMDRHFSSALGLPMSVQDSDITTPVNPPNVGSGGDSSRSLQVNLSHLLSIILTTIYKPNVTPLETFLEQTRSILHTLAHHAQEIEKIMRLKLQNCIGSLPRGICYLTLLYHQCVIVATRPLLLSVLKERLDMLGYPGDENWKSFLAQTGSVISTGIKSAAKTLQILTSEYSLLGEAFLPYDIEFAFGAALHVTMVNALFPGEVDYQGCRQLAHQVLRNLITRGNRVARARISELRHLEKLFQELIARVQQQGHQTLNPFPTEGSEVEANEGHDRLLSSDNEPSTLAMITDSEYHSHCSRPHETSNMDFLEDIGISSEEFLSIVQEIGDPESLPENMLTLV